MSGKSYNQREMKSIVDYLVEQRFYNETKGRKMWMDYANSNLTTRTWQSLKETFLKRILPDITNPYYRLDPDQILSFKRGLDLTQKDKKLEFKPVNESVNKDTNGDNEQPGTSKHSNEENATGEDTQCSKIVHDRASTETLILETYETAEDIQRELEKTDEESDKEKTKRKTKPALKSVRDFIEYSEPLTPMLQEVLDDFATDEDGSDTEPPMQIDENYVAQDEIAEPLENVASSQSILQPNTADNLAKHEKIEKKDNIEETRNEKQVTKHKEESIKSTDETVFSQLEDVMVLVDEALAKNLDKELNTEKVENLNMKSNSCESSITLTDSLLPNNQEAVKNLSSIDVQSPVLPTPNVNSDQGNKENNGQLDSNSKTHNISDEEQDKVVSQAPNIVESNKERSNNNENSSSQLKSKMTLIQDTAQNTSPKSPKKHFQVDCKIHEVHSDSSASDKEENVKFDNPCLQSVSLYAEQSATTKYSDSDSNNKEITNEPPKPSGNDVPRNDEAVKNKQKNDKAKESEVQRNDEPKPADNVILLHSRTTSESVDDSLTNHRPLARSSLKMQKDKKLASVFGFSNGGDAKSRRLGSRKRTISHRNISSDSSDWTSASDSDFVSPPNGRRNKYARKYLKPHSARIMSLDEEGGLFVMLGKKVYPLVKAGKAMKNYVTYLPESDPEEDESYWKSRYIEERKQTTELKKKLGQTNGVRDKTEKESSISLSSPTIEIPSEIRRSRQQSLNGNNVLMRRDSGAAIKTNQETLKIKFTKKGQEVQLEGHWQDINPVLEHVVSMFQKEPEVKKSHTVTCVELSSGNATPVVIPNGGPRDKGVHDKINELESAIFKQIEEHDVDEVVERTYDRTNAVELSGENKTPVEKAQESNTTVEKAQKNNSPVKENQENKSSVENAIEETAEEQPRVTLRKKRGRPKKEVSPAVSVAQSPAKRPKKSTEANKANDVEGITAQEIKNSTPNVTRQTRTPRKLLDAAPSKTKMPRKSTAKVQPEPVEVQETPIEDSDEQVRYKFPSPEPEVIQINSKDSPKKNLPNITSPDSLSRHSVNSSQGYQDSDTSPFHIGKRRRRLSVSTSLKGKKTQRSRRRSYPLLKQMNNDSSNSSFNISVRREQSTVNSEVYRSESYQFLMPRTKSIMQRLEKIDETNPNENDLIVEIRKLRDAVLQADATNKNDAASSSTLSLPLSPEWSIVENLSISKSALAVADDPTINETQGNDVLKTCNDKYLLSAIDVSMPLMAQNCALQESYKKHLMSALSNLSDNPNSAGRNLSESRMRISIASESTLKNISAINIQNSDSLDRRLEQLLLESAQKPVNEKGGEKMEVDTVVKKKSGSRKRCSTPHKKTVQSKKKVIEEAIVEEESKARCSRGGRRSCPPSINIVYYEDNAPDNLEINIHDESIDLTTITKSKRVRKDIIKVKIAKPKGKAQKKKSKNKTPDVSKTSNTEVDNESGVFLQGCDDSGDLIHNHSETCLQIGDCMGDSVEFIETTTKSIISLDSSSISTAEKENLDGNSIESEKTTPEVFCENAQCAVHFEAQASEPKSIDSGNTVYFTPFVSRCNSILTEDLSDEAPVTKRTNFRNSKWYLLSDEESNTNYFDVQENDTPSYGANLQQLFPITCAVPDLSTITEMSERNENSQKASLDVGDDRSSK